MNQEEDLQESREAAISESAQEIARFLDYLKALAKDDKSFVRVITVVTAALVFQATEYTDDRSWPLLVHELRDLSRRFGQHPDVGLRSAGMEAVEVFVEHFEALGSHMLRNGQQLRQSWARAHQR